VATRAGTVAAVGDLARDTIVEGSAGRYRSGLAEDWRIWGPMGGYVASVALRAAAAEVDGGLEPASLTCQFLSAAAFAPVDLEATVRRASRRTALVDVRLGQEGAAVVDAQVWFAAPADVIEHDFAGSHRYGRPLDHPPIRERTDERSPYPFWNNFERRPVDWIDDWESFEGGDPEWAEWLSFTPTADFDDPVIDVCRLIVLADLPSYPAAMRAHPRSGGTWMAPSLDLSVQFHRVRALGEWLLVHGRAPVAHRGLLAFRSEVWTADGRCAASGSGQLLARALSPPT
jgi:acyl-CoA thioesterase-2